MRRKVVGPGRNRYNQTRRRHGSPQLASYKDGQNRSCRDQTYQQSISSSNDRAHMNLPQVQYCNCMEEVKLRIAMVLAVLEGKQTIGREDFDAELVCVHLRKSLELIAFASLTANKEQYATVYKDFESHWNAKRLLANLEKLHPPFYPRPVQLTGQDEKGVKHLADVTDGYLTRGEFIFLYQKCSEVLHARNPFRSDSRTINFGCSIREWVVRIQRLLALHYMQLAGSEKIWVVIMQHPEDGKVHTLTSEPVDPAR